MLCCLKKFVTAARWIVCHDSRQSVTCLCLFPHFTLSPIHSLIVGGEAGRREPLLLRKLPRQAERHPQDQAQQPSSDSQPAAHALHL